MPESLDSYRTFEDKEIDVAWEKFISQTTICDDEFKMLKIAFYAGWKGHEKFYREFYCDDGK